MKRGMKRILVVEDDEQVRFVMEHVLLAAGYAVDAVGNASLARFYLGTRPYDLVLADGRLPDGDGIEVADFAGEQGAKALIVTGYAMQFPMERLGRHPYLIKPVRPVELVERVRELIGDPQAQVPT
jgi:DNA-binding response OmpR family regulator